MSPVSTPLFFDVPEELADYAQAAVAVLPVPFERTTSYGRGTADGPHAILRASHQVELWEEITGREPYLGGIATLPPLNPGAEDLAKAIAAIEEEAHRHLQAGKFLVVLGGEHSLTAGPVRAARRLHPDLGVVQFDAHADLRESYEGTPHSHACVMKRLVDEEIPTLAIGIRAFSREERELVDRRSLPTIWGWELPPERARFEALLDTLPDHVYLTFDVDYFDPSVLSSTGTPVPGGGTWYPTLELLEIVFARKTVVAMDVVELAPRLGHHECDFVAASLIYKCLAFRAAGSRA